MISLNPLKPILYLKKELFPPRLIDKYIFREFISVFLGTIVLLAGVMLISQIMDNMRSFMNSKQPPFHIGLYLLYNLPKILVAVIPPSLMFSVCFVIGQFNVNKELVSIMAAGVSFYRSAMTIFLFGGVMWLFVFAIGEFLVRPANSMAGYELSIIMKGIGTKQDLVYQLHTRGKEGFYYVYWYDNTETKIKGGFNYIKMSPNYIVEYVVSAQSATYQKETNDWLLENVEEIKFKEDLNVSSFLKFKEKSYSFPEGPEYFQKPRKTVEQMNFLELSEEIENRKQKGKPFYDLEVERQSIFAMPLMCIIVVIIGAITGTFTKRSAGIASLGLTIGMVLIYYIFFSIGKSLSENGGVPPAVGVWFTPVLFSGISFYLYKKFNL
ncbi:MAG: LptF/LptG family permease [Leptospiraceae bacterium]|nr:LptF/LptG family permease [Leptospiraceae bacterium]MCP5513176.1 LptF/LptG family permease [Leptospiraceae bacterium]